MGKHLQIILIFSIVLGVVFLPTTLLLLIGMLPTLVVMFLDRSRGRLHTITIGAMNFAACMPYVLRLWAGGHNFDSSFDLLSDPVTIVVMYGGAVMGYMIEWSVGGVVSSLMHQSGVAREKYITQRQKELIALWGKEVAGDALIESEENENEEDAEKESIG